MADLSWSLLFTWALFLMPSFIESFLLHCSNEVETILHYLCDCCRSKHVWYLLGFLCCPNFMQDDLHAWLHQFSYGTDGTVFMMEIWKSHMILRYISSSVLDIQLSFGLLARCQSSLRYVKWKRLPHGWFKLKVDGSLHGDPKVAGFRGLI